MNVKRVERIWRREGLKVPQKQPKRGRLWLNDGSCIRLRPLYPNPFWSYDFIEDRAHNGREYRMLNVIDEFTRECLAIRVNRKLRSPMALSDQFILPGIPGHIRSDNGQEFVARPSASGLPPLESRPPTSSEAVHGRTATVKAFNSKLRDELLNGEIFYTPQVIIENWRRHYNTIRPHSSLGFRPPAPEALMPAHPARNPAQPLRTRSHRAQP